MFDLFSPSHLLLVGIAILVFVGPKDLPRFMLAVGKWTRKAKGMLGEFRNGLEAMERDAELHELRKELDAMRAARPASPGFGGGKTSPAVAMSSLPVEGPREAENEHALEPVELAALS